MGKPRVVTAVASMTSHGVLGDDAVQNTKIINAMVAAVKDLQARGVTDTEIIRAAQLEARDKVLAS